jgi:hypothetical protein
MNVRFLHTKYDFLTYQEPSSVLAICGSFLPLTLEAIFRRKALLPTAMLSVQSPSLIRR